jgi:pyridoxine kinase
LALAVSSQVAYGSVGNRALVFGLEALGVRTAAIATVQLPFHPGHGPSCRIALPATSLEAALDALASNRRDDPISAVVTGYFADAAQVEVVAAFVRRLRNSASRPLFVCDPVIGDSAGLYVPEMVAEAVRDSLIPLADVATPNRFELAWLAGTPPVQDIEIMREQARTLGPPTVLVTSARQARGRLSNLLVVAGQAWIAEHAFVDGPKNGQGDFTAGLFCGHLALGRSPRVALGRTVAAVFEIMRRSKRAASDELLLAGSAAIVARPGAKASVRRLARRREQ